MTCDIDVLTDGDYGKRIWTGWARERDKARSRANETTDTELLEQVDLLGIRIAQDMGDCAETTRVLRDFLTSYPKSSFTPMARQTLEKQSCT